LKLNSNALVLISMMKKGASAPFFGALFINNGGINESVKI